MRIALVLLAASIAAGARAIEPQILKPASALPAHVAGAFDIADCQQAPDGTYYIFDRRNHSVHAWSPDMTEPKKLTQIGLEAGRILQPVAFDLAADGSFVVADAPGGPERVQVFLGSGARVGGFILSTRGAPRITMGNSVLSGIGSLEYTGKSLFISHPELGSLVTEYDLEGRVVRSFGELRKTGQEPDSQVHVAMNSGIIVPIPAGGFYFVFYSGLPMFRKYDAAGTLVYERHIEGTELDELVRTLPTTWKRRRDRDGEFPIIVPNVRTAGVDQQGNLWISLWVPFTYVYDVNGDKRRTVKFQAAGVLAPDSFFFTRDRRVLATPGCYAFEAK